MHGGGIVGGGIGGMGSQTLTQVCLGVHAARCRPVGKPAAAPRQRRRHLRRSAAAQLCIPAPGPRPAAAGVEPPHPSATRGGRVFPQRRRPPGLCGHRYRRGRSHRLCRAHRCACACCGMLRWMVGWRACLPACLWACGGLQRSRISPGSHAACCSQHPLACAHPPTHPPAQAACCLQLRRASASTRLPSSGAGSWPPAWAC